MFSRRPIQFGSPADAGIFERFAPRVGLLLCSFLIASVAPAVGQDVTSHRGGGDESIEVDLQGHRGARGLLPENSIPGFIEALDLGVETLEMDVVVTADLQVVVSHEPWMSSVICRKPSGEPIEEAEERSFNIFALSYRDVAAFDCGGRGHPDFPEQRPLAVAKPLLLQVLQLSDGYAHVIGRTAPRYNIEIKSAPDHDGLYHPSPDSFARLVYDVVVESGASDRVTIQSFDPRSLRAVRALDPSIPLALLVSNDDGFDANVRRLGIVPQIYSPRYDRVDRDLMDSARDAGVAVIPWTVNAPEAMRSLLELGVNGLITDYPDRGRAVVDAFASGGLED